MLAVGNKYPPNLSGLPQQIFPSGSTLHATALFLWIGSGIQAKGAAFGYSFLLAEGKEMAELHDDS